MDHFLYRDGALFAEDVAISEIAAAVGTRFCVTSRRSMMRSMGWTIWSATR